MEHERTILWAWKKKKFWMRYTMLLLLLTFTVGSNVGFSQKQKCQEKYNLKADSKKKKLKYEYRGNRCEGFYVVKTSSKKWITVAGFVKGHFKFNTSKTETIRIIPSISMNCDIQIRAVGIPRRMFYRMDATLKTNQQLDWPVRDVIYEERLTYEKIGVYGWIPGRHRKTYIPLVVSSDEIQNSNDGILRLHLRPSVKVNKVKWRKKTGLNQDKSYKPIPPDNKKTYYDVGDIIKIKINRDLGSEFIIEIVAINPDTTEKLYEVVRVKIGK